MSDDNGRPGERRYDNLLTHVDRYLDRLSIGLMVASIPICQARLPHYRDVAIAGLACALATIVFAVMVRLGKRVGVIGPDALADKRTSTICDDGIGFARPTLPIERGVIIERGVMMDMRSGTSRAADVGERHEVFVTGVGKITYRFAERRSDGIPSQRG